MDSRIEDEFFVAGASYRMCAKVYPSRRMSASKFVSAGLTIHHVLRDSHYMLYLDATYDWLRYLKTNLIHRVHLYLIVLSRQLVLCLIR